MIEIHFDYTDGTEVSYQEGKDLGDNFTTCCLEFFSTDRDAIVLKKNGDYISVKELLLNDGRFTRKEIRTAHNISRILRAGGFQWQKQKTK